VALAIKPSRERALLPYAHRTLSERAGGRAGPRGPRGPRRDDMDDTPTFSEDAEPDVLDALLEDAEDVGAADDTGGDEEGDE
jgi:hypothetical protein